MREFPGEDGQRGSSQSKTKIVPHGWEVGQASTGRLEWFSVSPAIVQEVHHTNSRSSCNFFRFKGRGRKALYFHRTPLGQVFVP